jgi:diacylglycerol kinase family enzyme
VVLANAAAGSVDDRALGTVVRVLAEHGPTRVERTAGPDDLDRVLSALDGWRPVVAGGDGSLHTAVNRLVALGLGATPVGLVPLGTGNDFARGVGLSLDPARDAATAATGRPSPVAVAAHPGGEVVVNNAHWGLGERASRVAVGLKPRLGPAAYPAAALAVGLRPERQPVVVTVGGEVVHDGPLLALLVAIGPSAGGGHRLVPDADPGEPRLDVVAVSGATTRQRLAVALDAVRRRRDPTRSDGVQRWRTDRVVVRPGGGTHRWDVDGEHRHWPAPVELAVVPAAWRVVVPVGEDRSEP